MLIWIANIEDQHLNLDSKWFKKKSQIKWELLDLVFLFQSTLHVSNRKAKCPAMLS